MDIMVGKAKVQATFNPERQEYVFKGLLNRDDKPYDRTIKVSDLAGHVQQATVALGADSEAAFLLVVTNLPQGQAYEFNGKDSIGLAVSENTGKLSVKPTSGSRFPLTNSYQNWERILDEADRIRAFIQAHKARMDTIVASKKSSK